MLPLRSGLSGFLQSSGLSSDKRFELRLSWPCAPTIHLAGCPVEIALRERQLTAAIVISHPNRPVGCVGVVPALRDAGVRANNYAERTDDPAYCTLSFVGPGQTQPAPPWLVNRRAHFGCVHHPSPSASANVSHRQHTPGALIVQGASSVSSDLPMQKQGARRSASTSGALPAVEPAAAPAAYAVL